MGKRSLRVTKWLGTTPAIGFCTFCAKEFKVPMTALTKTAKRRITTMTPAARKRVAAKAAKARWKSKT